MHKAYVSFRYHRKRQRFFDLLDKLTKAFTVLLGATLIGESLKFDVPLFASGISLLGLLSLVFGYGDRKQAHKELAETAMLLAGEIEEATARALSDQLAGKWEASLAKLNAKEPPALKTLVIICEHEQAVSTGHPDHIRLPGWWRRFISDFIP